MGWKWWNKENNSNQYSADQSQSQTQPTFQTKTFFKSYSSSRSCKQDPHDQNFLICTEKVNDGNNTYEKEQKVPVNQNQGENSNKLPGLFLTPFFNNQGSFSNHIQNSTDEFDRMMLDFMNSKFIFPSFFSKNQGFNEPGIFFDNPFQRRYQDTSNNQYSQHGPTNYDWQGSNNAQNNYFKGSFDSSRQKNAYKENNSTYFSHSKNKDCNIKDI